jgi:hypothetical protein
MKEKVKESMQRNVGNMKRGRRAKREDEMKIR